MKTIVNLINSLKNSMDVALAKAIDELPNTHFYLVTKNESAQNCCGDFREVSVEMICGDLSEATNFAVNAFKKMGIDYTVKVAKGKVWFVEEERAGDYYTRSIKIRVISKVEILEILRG